MELETLLDQDYSLGFNPYLAESIGIPKALMLAYLHSTIEAYGMERDGRDWIYSTYDQLHTQLPFWSKGTIKRIILSLEKEGFMVSSNYNNWKMDKTKWYSICYEKYIDMREDPDKFLLDY
ncbi:hypothetical protein [Peribacillus sp. NPDC096540]|uniref:hypothetical protein n=1 Tax=Peribacillus sp. NPDC096540 TaxID=3390612 RepID=UPI003D001FAD